MPFGLRWPFGRKRSAPSSTLPVQREADSSDAIALDDASLFDDAAPAPDLGLELMNRVSDLSTPPMLGDRGGLDMALLVSGADEFIQQLSLVAGQPETSMPQPGALEFTESLSSLSSFASLEAMLNENANVVFADELPAPDEFTDILPPLGSLPNQLPGLMGVAPELTNFDRPTARPIGSSEPSIDFTTIASPLKAIQNAPAPAISEPSTSTAQSPIERGGLLDRPLMSQVVEPWPLNDLTPNLSHLTESPRVSFETMAQVAPPIAPALNDFTENLPLANLSQDLVALPASETPAASELSADINGPASERLSISRYADDLPLPNLLEGSSEVAGPFEASGTSVPAAPIDAVEETPLRQSLPNIDFSDFIQPPILSIPSIGEFTQTLVQPELSQDFIGRPESPARSIREPVSDAGESSREPSRESLSISRFAEDLPLPDLTEGQREASQPQARSQTRRAPLHLGLIDTRMPTGMSPAISLSDNLPSLGQLTPTPSGPVSVQRMTAAEEMMPTLSSLAGSIEAESRPTLSGLAESLSSTGEAAQSPIGSAVTPIQRSLFGGLADNLSLGGLTQNLPSLGGLAQNLPSLGGLAGNLPALGGLAGNLPTLGGLAENVPSLGGIAQTLGSGLTSPEMPLPPSIGDAIGGLSGAAQNASGAAQEAMGQITSMAPSMPEMPQLPSIDKLTDQVWRQIQQKLKVERERTRGLA